LPTDPRGVVQREFISVPSSSPLSLDHAEESSLFNVDPSASRMFAEGNLLTFLPPQLLGFHPQSQPLFPRSDRSAHPWIRFSLFQINVSSFHSGYCMSISFHLFRCAHAIFAIFAFFYTFSEYSLTSYFPDDEFVSH